MSAVAYTSLVGLVVAERISELFISRRNTEAQLKRGGVESGKGHYPFMVVLHTAFLIGCVVETWVFSRPFIPLLGFAMLAVLVVAQFVRYWVIRSLDGRWTTGIVVVPGDERVTRGPFRYLKHPNYVAVVAEGIALPLIHTNWITAVVFTIANIVLLAVRIRAESKALEMLR